MSPRKHNELETPSEERGWAEEDDFVNLTWRGNYTFISSEYEEKGAVI